MAYTGTHDNDTVRGWWDSASDRERAYAGKIFKTTEHSIRLHKSAEIMDFKIPYSVEELNAAKDKVVEFGGDPTDLQVQGVTRAVKADNGAFDYAASVAGVPALVEAGVTDIRFPASLTVDHDRAVEVLTPLVEAFRDVTR